MTAYHIRSIRLVNFHNFVDESIEVRDGGHLFLLGDNGSGKTTVLDAVHLVLSGGELELNAAARIGGRRDDGRTLQGIALRYDFERGVVNEGGALAYAALELEDVDGARRLALGVGLEATTMEARVAKWGFVATRPLDEIALVDAEARPVTRETLRQTLGPACVFFQMGQYRREVARRLFGSDRQHEEAIRFWGMAKAYREIVAGARDFGGLFERLLPAPDAQVFEDILRTLRAIDEIEVSMREVEAQRDHVAGLVELRGEVARAREAAARYRWLACLRARDEAATARDQAAADALRWTGEATRLDDEVAAARAGVERMEDGLRRAEADDAAGVVAAIRVAEARRRELEVEARQAARAADDDGRRARDAAAAARLAVEHLSAAVVAVAAELEESIGATIELPGDRRDLAACARRLRTIAEGLRGSPEPEGLVWPRAAAAEGIARSVLTGASERLVAAHVQHARATDEVEHASDDLDALEAGDEVAPSLPRLAEARRALHAAGIVAHSVFELLEPAPGAPAEQLAAIEALAGEETLAALIVTEDALEDARRIVATVAPSVRVVVATADAALPGWAAPLFVDDAARAPALCALAAALAQPRDLGDVPAPSGDGDVALRGLGFRASEREPRLLGAESRRRAHLRRIEEARRCLAIARGAAREAERSVAAAAELVVRAERLVRAANAIEGPTLTSTRTEMQQAVAWHERLTAVAADARGRADVAGARVVQVDIDLAALRARTAGVDVAEIERRLAMLAAAVATARADCYAHEERRAQARQEADRATHRATESERRALELTQDLTTAAGVLRAQLAALDAPHAGADDDALAHYVRVTQRGDSFRTLETLRQKLAEVDRAEQSAADEVERDGSRGVRCLAFAARFGFTYDRARNHIEDRRGQPAAGVLADLARTIDEQRSVVNDRTRALMDTLVMGDLARHLQGQIHALEHTMRGINRVLEGLRFGPTEYQFQIAPRDDRKEVVELVRRISILDEASRLQFRAWVDERIAELRAADDDAVPELLDYRRWFEFKLRMRTSTADGVELTHRLRQVGSGGEQGVPNYLLVLALAHLMFDAAGAAVRPLLFDEAFYGIDSGRRDQLLRLATDLGLQLFVASPDQDGVTPAVRAATTLFVAKDADHDVHLAPYHFWNRDRAPQPGLFDEPVDEPASAECRTAP